LSIPPKKHPQETVLAHRARWWDVSLNSKESHIIRRSLTTNPYCVLSKYIVRTWPSTRLTASSLLISTSRPIQVAVTRTVQCSAEINNNSPFPLLPPVQIPNLDVQSGERTVCAIVQELAFSRAKKKGRRGAGILVGPQAGRNVEAASGRLHVKKRGNSSAGRCPGWPPR
jgi:hypothetical protein